MTPYSKDSGQSIVRNSGETFIAPHHPDALQSPPPLALSLLARRPPSGAPSRSFSSCVPDPETIRSRRHQRLPDFPPESLPPPKRSAKQFPQNFPWMAQRREPYRRPLVREYYDLRKKRASPRQMPHRPAHRVTQVRQCCRVIE